MADNRHSPLQDHVFLSHQSNRKDNSNERGKGRGRRPSQMRADRLGSRRKKATSGSSSSTSCSTLLNICVVLLLFELSTQTFCWADSSPLHSHPQLPHGLCHQDVQFKAISLLIDLSSMLDGYTIYEPESHALSGPLEPAFSSLIQVLHEPSSSHHGRKRRFLQVDYLIREQTKWNCDQIMKGLTRKIEWKAIFL